MFCKRFALLAATFLSSLNPLNADTALQEWSQGNKHFTTTSYPYAKQAGFNFVYSPLSLQTAFAMACEMAKEGTQKEITEFLCLPENDLTRQSGAKSLSNLLNEKSGSSDSVALSLTNGAWISSDIILRQDLSKTFKESYQAVLSSADFIHSAEETRQEINAWVAENTQQKIQELMPNESLDESAKLVLVNTLYMKAPWQKPFDTNMTRDDVFYGLEKSLRPIPFMKQNGCFNVLEERLYTVVELPFVKEENKKAELAFYVVLPHSWVSLEDVEDQFTTRQLAHWIEDAHPELVSLSLPRFKVSSSFNGKEMLEQMGMQRVFSPKAEFDLEGETSGFGITGVFHKATFEVDETGGTGAAATSITIGVTSCLDPRPILPIEVNRPFLFVVAEKVSGTVLFSGRIHQPKE